MPTKYSTQHKKQFVEYLETEGRLYTELECAAYLNTSPQYINYLIKEHSIERPIKTKADAFKYIRKLLDEKNSCCC